MELEREVQSSCEIFQCMALGHSCCTSPNQDGDGNVNVKNGPKPEHCSIFHGSPRGPCVRSYVCFARCGGVWLEVSADARLCIKNGHCFHCCLVLKLWPGPNDCPVLPPKNDLVNDSTITKPFRLWVHWCPMSRLPTHPGGVELRGLDQYDKGQEMFDFLQHFMRSGSALVKPLCLGSPWINGSWQLAG